MIQLNEWEQLVVGFTIGIMGLLATKTKNATALAAIADFTAFLTSLEAGQVPTA